MISILNQILNTLSLSKKIKKLVLGKSKGEKVIIIRTTNIVENKCKDIIYYSSRKRSHSI